MWQCKKCGAEVADSHAACWECGTSADGGESAGLPLPAMLLMTPSPGEATKGMPPHRPSVQRFPPPGPQVGVPRRFSIGTLMILMTAFAVLFGMLKTFKVPPEWFAIISTFVAGVAACQVLMYQGKNPRKASFVGGMIVSGAMVVVAAVIECFSMTGPYVLQGIIGILFFGALGSVILGGPSGYAVGCIVASIFLVRKEPDDADPPPPPKELEPPKEL